MIEAGEPDAPVTQNLIRLPVPGDARDATQAAERVFEAMRIRLSSVLGAGGYSTLLARSLTLSRPAFPWLAGFVPDRLGSVAGRIEAISLEQPPFDVTSGLVSVLTHFTELLKTFIGKDLSDRLLTTVLMDFGGNAAVENRGNNSYDK